MAALTQESTVADEIQVVTQAATIETEGGSMSVTTSATSTAPAEQMSLVQLVGCIAGQDSPVHDVRNRTGCGSCKTVATNSSNSGGIVGSASSDTAQQQLSKLTALKELASRARSAAPELQDHHPLASSAKLKQTAVASVESLLLQHQHQHQHTINAEPAPALTLALEALLALSSSASSYKSKICKQQGALPALAALLQGATSVNSRTLGYSNDTTAVAAFDDGWMPALPGPLKAEGSPPADAALRLLAADTIKCLAWDGLAGNAQNQARLAAQPGLVSGLVALLRFAGSSTSSTQANSKASDNSKIIYISGGAENSPAGTSCRTSLSQEENTDSSAIMVQHCNSPGGTTPTRDPQTAVMDSGNSGPESEATAAVPTVSAASVRRKAAHALACICAGNAATQTVVAAAPGALSSLVSMLQAARDAGERLQAADTLTQLVVVRASGGRLQLLHTRNQEAVGAEPGAVQSLLGAVLGDRDSGVRLQAEAALRALVASGHQANSGRLRAALKAAADDGSGLTGTLKSRQRAECDWLQAVLLQNSVNK